MEFRETRLQKGCRANGMERSSFYERPESLLAIGRFLRGDRRIPHPP
jgi:hypothetical protein